MLSRKNKLRNWLGRNHPRIFSFSQQGIQRIKRIFGIVPYKEARSDFNYYREVVRLARKFAPQGESVLDVGGSESNVLDMVDWFRERTVLDIRYVPPREGITTVTSDYLSYDEEQNYDLVLCLQVLEHLNNPAQFSRKLFTTGKHVIISVPYKWPTGMCPGHVQDPVDEHKLRQWTNREPIETHIVSDKKDRLIAVYEGNS